MSNKYCKHKQMIGQMARVDTLVQDWSSVDCVFCKEEKVEVSVPKQYCPHQEYISLLFHKDIPYEYDCPWCNPLTTQRPPSEEKDWLVEVIEKSIAGPFDGAITANAIRSHIEKEKKENRLQYCICGHCVLTNAAWEKFLGIRKDGEV